MQRAAFDGLGDKKGAVAAIEPRTGRILALVSTPSYDPGELSGNGAAVGAAWHRLNGAERQPMLNRALRQTYPPGSTFKVVTAAAALESGKVTDIEAPTDSPDPYLLPGTDTLLGNAAKGCEDAPLKDAFRASCNTVFARLGAGIGLDGMADTARRFGFNDRRLRILARRAEQLRYPDGRLTGRAVRHRAVRHRRHTAPDGDGRGGGRQRRRLTAPSLVDKETDARGVMVTGGPHRPTREVTGPGTAQRLQEMMVDVVEHGSGQHAAIKGVTVGGKTGTAQHGVHNEGTPYAWFISWARAKDSYEPAVAVAVVVEDAAADRADISGGGSAAPIARAVMAAALG